MGALDFPDAEPTRRGMRYINPDDAMTPREMEQLLAELYNEHIRAEVKRRELNDHLLDCVLAYEKAFIIATMDPECPRPKVNQTTVAERDAWIRGICFGEWEALEMAKTNLENQDRYIKVLVDNTSKMQSTKGLITSSFDLPASHGSSQRW